MLNPTTDVLGADRAERQRLELQHQLWLPRAVPMVEAMVALVLADHLLRAGPVQPVMSLRIRREHQRRGLLLRSG